jgi:hypothetical protein
VLQLIMVGATIAFPNLVIDGITQTQKVDADKVLQQMLEAAPEAEPSASEPEAGASSPAAEPGQESGEEKQAEEDDPMKALMESMKKDAAKK